MDDDWGDQERRECPRCQGESAFDGEPRCAMCRSRGYVIGATLAEIQAADAEVAALGAETLRPEAPDCAAWPKCGREVVGYCPCAPREAAPTVRLPRPDPVASVWLLRMERAALMGRVDRLDEALRTLLGGMTDAQRAELGDAR